MKNLTKKKTQKEILARLALVYADVKPALHFKNPYELLIAVLLSAQCTDERVNIVTEDLFEKAPNAAAMAELGEANVKEIIRSCGLYQNKAKNIVALSRILAAQYGGEVPRAREALEALPGIGRKSANVVMSIAFGLPAIAVDTHVFRVSRRMGLSGAADVRNVENDLMALIPQEDWGAAHHWLIFHGRRVCKAAKPLCDNCPVGDICPRLLLKNKEN